MLLTRNASGVKISAAFTQNSLTKFFMCLPKLLMLAINAISLKLAIENSRVRAISFFTEAKLLLKLK